MIIRKSAQEIAKMAAAGRIVAETIAHVGEQLEPGVTTGELDRIAEEVIRSHGGTPTSKGYRGFPAAICISPNSMVVHGIPGAYEVVEGDLITIDVGVTLDGYIADSAFTFGVGEVAPESQRLLFDTMARTAASDGLDEPKVLQWDFRDAPSWHLRLANGATAAEPGHAQHSDLTLRCRFEDWVDIFSGRLDPRLALATGRLRPRGSLRMLLKLPQIFGG